MNRAAERLLNGLPYSDQDSEERQRRDILAALNEERRNTVDAMRTILGLPHIEDGESRHHYDSGPYCQDCQADWKEDEFTALKEGPS